MNKKKILFFLMAIYCFGGLYLLFYDKLPFHFPCIFKTLTGYPCPGCGMTRATVALSKGDFLGAVHQNFLVFVLIAFFLFLTVAVVVDLIKKTKYTEKILYPKFNKIGYVFLGVVVIGQWVWHIFQEI